MIKWKRFIDLGIFLLAAAILVYHALSFMPFFSDDGFISLRYSKRLMQGLGLTWTDGEKVEGYTNLLWVLLNGVTGALISNFPAAARFWGLLGAVTAVLFVSLSPAGRIRIERIRVLTGGMVLALSAPLAVWAIGGLEQGLLSGLLAVALYFLMRALDSDSPDFRNLMLSGLFFGLVAVTRADSLLFFVVAAFGVLLSRGLDKATFKTIAVLSIAPVFFFGSQLVFRIFYYGELLPNTALVKVAFNTARLGTGLTYITGSVHVIAVLLTLALFGAVLLIVNGRRHRALIPLVTFVAWTAYVTLIGGDIFRAWRHIVPALVPLAFLLAESACHYREWLAKHWAAGIAGLAILLCIHLILQFTDEKSQGVREKDHWEWRARAAGQMLKTAFGKQKPLLAVDAAGALPYWSDLPALDMLGLTDKYLVRHPPKGFGRRGIGHELGDGRYVLLKRHPDIIVFNSAMGSLKPHWPSGKQLFRLKRFKTGYQYVTARKDDAFIRMYVKMENSPIGIGRNKGTVRVPGYFFSGGAKSKAARLRKGKLVLPVSQEHSGHLFNLSLSKGTWQIAAKGPVLTQGIGVECANGQAPRAVGKVNPYGLMALKLDSKQLVNIVARPLVRLWLSEAVLTRVPDKTATHVCRPPNAKQTPQSPRRSSARQSRTGTAPYRGSRQQKREAPPFSSPRS